MNIEENYLAINRASWNNRTATHLQSAFYDLDSFLQGRNSLNDVELQLLGDVSGKSILHLQCHFGQDTISLNRLGANVTGVDLSDKAIDSAIQIAKQTQSTAQFICCDIYDLPNHLDQTFDIVFTSYGTIGWLPDLDKWANIVARFLKPGGQFVFVEFHPFLWMFNDNFDKISYRYFTSAPIVETLTGTYADKSADISITDVSWNHGLGEVLTSLIKHQLEINTVDEYDYSPYNCFSHMIEYEPKKYRIAHMDNLIPMVYAIVATKKNKS